jgi:uracil-DNA glycosylase family 4
VPVQSHHGNVQNQLTQYSVPDAANALAWLVGAGADVVVDEAPRNWLEAPATAATPSASPRITQNAPVARAHTAAAIAVANPATALAAAAGDLVALDAAVAGFDHPLRRAGTAPQLLTGATASGVIIVSDQPEADDSPTARLLARMLAAIGLNAGNCARANLLPWSTPAGRPPKDTEVADFEPFRARAFELAPPRLVLALGERAAALAAHPNGPAARGIASLRGKWLDVGEAPLLATFHPRILLTQPEFKRLAWADLQAFAARIETLK